MKTRNSLAQKLSDLTGRDATLTGHNESLTGRASLLTGRISSKRNGKNRIRRILTAALALAVVVSMTGALTLPAVTMTKTAALKSGGIDVLQPQSAQSTGKDVKADTSSEKFQKEGLGMPENLKIAAAGDDSDISGSSSADDDKSAGKGDETGSKTGANGTSGKNDDKGDKTAGNSGSGSKDDNAAGNSSDKDGKTEVSKDSDKTDSTAKDPDGDKENKKNSGNDKDAEESAGDNDKSASEDAGDAAKDAEDADDADTKNKDKGSAEDTPKLLTSKTEIKYEGDGYTVTATVDKDAKLPENTQLTAEEIERGSGEYFQYLGRTWAEVNKEYLDQRDKKKQGFGEADNVEDIRPVNLDVSRFFDVSFVYGDKEIEPKAPVKVNIQLDKGLSNSADSPITGIVHFRKATAPDKAAATNKKAAATGKGKTDKKADNTKIELINDVKSVKDKDGSTVEYSCKLDSFSVLGAYLGQKTEEAGFSPEDPAVTMPKLTALRAGEGNSGLKALEASKTLTPNTLEDSDQTDGTYTLSLSVKGDAVESEQITKANVLIVMDRSTSMRQEVSGAGVPFTGTTPEQGKTYYGIVDNEIKTLNYDSGTGKWTYTSQDGEGNNTTNEYNGTVYVNGTRLQAEQAALDEMVASLTGKNTTKNPDAIEVCIASFASARGSELSGAATGYSGTTSGHDPYSNGTETGWETTYGSGSQLYDAVHDNSINNGTNWEDALIYAKELADAKQAQPGQANEEMYVIFMTDGVPTAIYGETSKDTGGWGALHYTGKDNQGRDVVHGNGSEAAYEYARDGSACTRNLYNDINSSEHPEVYNAVSGRRANLDADDQYPTRAIVNEGYHFYTIFTFNPEEASTGFLKRLTNFAYGNEDDATDTPETETYYTDAADIASLKQSFDNIFKDINNLLAHGDVKIVDGLSTDSMTTNIVDGKADGIRYKVEDETGKLVYSVTAAGSDTDPKVTFKVGDENYTYDPDEANNQVRKITKFTQTSEQTEGDTKTRTEVTTTITVGGGKTIVATNTIVRTSEDGGATYTFVSDTKGTPVEYDSEDPDEVTIPEGAENVQTYYSVSVNGVEYKMALAGSVTTDAGTADEARTLTWDLSPIGALKKDYTYTAELVVWPNQEAYDYVAGLNNFPDVDDDEFEWDEDRAEEVKDEETGEILYYKGGVEQYPSIVKYPDGTFSVLTNTKQEVTYSDVYIQNTNDIITSEDKTPHEKQLDPPNPMPLEFTDTFLEKEWSADRNPALLAQVLYKPVGDDIASTGFQAGFDIYQGTAYKTDDTVKPYKTVELGWVNDLDDEGNVIYLEEGQNGEYVLEVDPDTGEPTGKKIKGHYVWDDETLRSVTYNGHEVQIGTRWSSKFAIATGLMLSNRDHVINLGLDPDDYPTAQYGDKTYYILEKGHDYYVEEQAELGYQFDFIAPVFHPMLVDGQLMNVVFEDGFAEPEGEPDPSAPLPSYQIEDIKEAPGGSGNLKVANKLRAYINIEKLVVDKDGVTPLPDDDTKFTYQLDLVSPLDPGPFEGTHVPWYGINGLFYHTYEEEVDPITSEVSRTYTYYQATVTNSDTTQSHTLKLKTESGKVYDAVCTDENGNELDDRGQPYIFDEDVTGPTYVTYSYEVPGENEEDEPTIEKKTLLLYGNQLDQAVLKDSETGEVIINSETGKPELSTKHISTTMQIKQGQRLSLSNIPQETRYTITELPEQGYGIVDIRKEIMNGSAVESRDVYSGEDTISGTVVPDRDNNFIFTNKIYSADITVKKIDEKNKPLPGAVFTLTREGGEPVALPAEGETDTGTYNFNGLEDGNYTLTETSAPAGYALIGAGTANEGIVATFKVTNDHVTNVSRPNSGDVQWDEETLTFTVKDDTLTDSLTVRKRWLDSDGELDSAGANEVNVTLKRRVEVPEEKYLTVTVNAVGNNGSASKTSNRFLIEKDAVTVRWDDNSQFFYDRNRIPTPVQPPFVFTDRTNHSGNAGSNLEAIWEISNLSAATGDVEITINYNIRGDSLDARNGWFFGRINGTTINISSVASSANIPISDGTPQPDDSFEETLTLSDANRWAVTKKIGGTDSNHTDYDYPATDNNGNRYYYYIVEETPEGSDSLPGCEPPTYSVNNGEEVTEIDPGITQGILTATNKKTERGSLAVQKLVQIAGSANGNLSRANGKYNFTVKDGSGTVIKHVQIRYENGTATYKVSNSEIPDTDNAGFRRVYAEGAIVDDLIPGTYTVTETEHQLDDPANDMKLVDIKVNGDNTFDLDDGTATLAVTAGDVASATTSYTNMVIPLTDVPVNKTWSWSDADQEHFNKKEIDSWSATFYLQYREVYDSGEPDDPQNVQSLWAYVQDGNSPKQIMISSQDPQGNVADAAAETFAALPQYKLHEKDGKIGVYHLKYAVDEVAYTIHYKDGTSSTWTKDGQSEAFGEHYSPAYDEDATQTGESISVINAPSSIREQKNIDLELQKMWEGEDGTVSSEPPDENFKAKFKLKRYYHEEYLEISNSSSIDLVKLTLDLGNGKTTELEVPRGAPVYFTADLKAECPSLNLTFRRVSPSEPSKECNLTYPNPGHYASTDDVVRFVVSDSVTLTDDETWEFVPGSSSSADDINKYVLGGIDGVRLATFDFHGNNHGQSQDFPYDVTGEVLDTTYDDVFELNSVNDWTKSFSKLPQIVEKITEAGGHTYLTTTVYSYFFEEIECDPPEYYAVFRDHNNAEVRYGDELSRIEVSGLTIDAINKPNPETLLYKVDKNNINQTDIEDYLLEGAQFKVVKFKTDEFQEIDGSWGDDGEKTAILTEDNKDGKFAVDGLVRGFYEIREIEFPAGYVQADGNPRFKVVVDPQSEKLVVEALPGNDALRIVNNYNDTGDNVIIYGNTPGVALPNSGGPGTTWIYLLGAILFIGAAIALASRRRTRQYS